MSASVLRITLYFNVAIRKRVFINKMDFLCTLSFYFYELPRSRSAVFDSSSDTIIGLFWGPCWLIGLCCSQNLVVYVFCVRFVMTEWWQCSYKIHWENLSCSLAHSSYFFIIFWNKWLIQCDGAWSFASKEHICVPRIYHFINLFVIIYLVNELYEDSLWFLECFLL